MVVYFDDEETERSRAFMAPVPKRLVSDMYKLQYHDLPHGGDDTDDLKDDEERQRELVKVNAVMRGLRQDVNSYYHALWKHHAHDLSIAHSVSCDVRRMVEWGMLIDFRMRDYESSGLKAAMDRAFGRPRDEYATKVLDSADDLLRAVVTHNRHVVYKVHDLVALHLTEDAYEVRMGAKFFPDEAIGRDDPRLMPFFLRNIESIREGIRKDPLSRKPMRTRRFCVHVRIRINLAIARPWSHPINEEVNLMRWKHELGRMLMHDGHSGGLTPWLLDELGLRAALSKYVIWTKRGYGEKWATLHESAIEFRYEVIRASRMVLSINDASSTISSYEYHSMDENAEVAMEENK